MNVGELCRAWRITAAGLRRAQQRHDPAHLDQLLTARERYLDELERHNPAGFQRWLEASVDSASDPSPYLAPSPKDEPRQT